MGLIQARGYVFVAYSADGCGVLGQHGGEIGGEPFSYLYNPAVRPPLGMPRHTQTHVNFPRGPCGGVWVCR